LVLAPLPPPPSLSSYTENLLPGKNLIANQLNKGGNTLNEILPVVPDGTVVSKFENLGGNWIRSTYNAALRAWDPSNIKLSPGEGAFIESTSNFSLIFSGTPNMPVLPIAIPGGIAWLVSRQTNDLGNYQDIVGSAPTPGARVYQWDRTNS